MACFHIGKKSLSVKGNIVKLNFATRKYLLDLIFSTLRFGKKAISKKSLGKSFPKRKQLWTEKLAFPDFDVGSTMA